MNKQEFIEQLRAALNGSVPPNVVIENVNFYEDYINMELRKGRTEGEILQELGSPRLIARTIKETSAKQSDNNEQQSNDYRRANYGNGQNAGGYYETDRKNKFRVPSRLWAVAIILIVVIVLGVVLSILSFLAPIIIAVIVVLSLVKLFRDWLN